MKQMIWIARESNGNADDMRVSFDFDQAKRAAEYYYSHLTKYERKCNVVSIEGYVVEVTPGDNRSAETIVNAMLIEDTFPYDPVFYKTIDE